MVTSVRTPRPNGRVRNLPTDITTRYMADIASAVSKLCDASSDKYRFKAEYLLKEFPSKFNDGDSRGAEDRKAAAIKKWLAAESRNAGTNLRVRFDECDFGYTTSRELIAKARTFIAGIIGEEPPVDLFDLGEFTNGASTGIPRRPSAIAEKFVGKADVSSSCAVHFLRCLEESPAWKRVREDLGLGHNITDFSVMFTVPKNSDIDRVACKEPEINMYLQRAAGLFIRDRLRRRGGCDLQDQSVNRRLARQASLNGDLATIDLSSASDTITEALVWEIMPLGWAMLLDDLRVKQTRLPDGTMHNLNMFSSMGNGFTFELESLIFLALTRATAFYSKIRGRISVYGDDIICPSALAPRLQRVFSWFGFKVNPKKSYWKGRFRESCGGHYYRGYDVTPFYIRAPMVTPRDLIHQLNQLREWIVRESFHGLWTYTSGDYFISDLSLVWEKYSRYIPSILRGGRDMETNTSLVSRDKPSHELLLVSRPRRVIEEGGYLHWLRARIDTGIDIETSSVQGTNFTVVRRVPKDRAGLAIPLDWLFVHELLDRNDATCVTPL